MEFPILVYTSPGPITYPGDVGTYNFKQVNDFDELERHLSVGYHMSAIEAIFPKLPQSDDQEPSRQDLIQRARDLQINFPKNITTSKLLSLIEEKAKD